MFGFKPFGLTQRLFLYLVLICIIPLLVLGMLSYNISNNTIRQEMRQYTLSILNEKSQYMAQIMEEVESLIANISSIEDIKKVISDEQENANDYDRLATQAKIGYILSGYTNLKGLVSIDIFSSNSNHYHVGDTLNVQTIDKSSLERIQSEVASQDQSIVWTGIEENVNVNSKHNKVITAAKAMKVIEVGTIEEKTKGIIIVNYDVDVFYNHFGAEATEYSDFMMIIDHKNRIIYHPNKSNIGSTINKDFVEKLTGSEGHFIDQIDNKQMFINYRRSMKSNWLLISFNPVSNLDAKIFSIQRNTLYALAFSFLLVIIFSFILSKQVVAPIKNITGLFKEIRAGTIDISIRLQENQKDEIGELIKWFNTFLGSLAEKKRTEEELLASREQAEAANRSKSAFLANMSHEIRTPMNAIVGMTDMLIESDLRDSQRELALIVHDSANALLTIINDILDFSKIEAGKMVLEKRSLDITHVVEGVAELLVVKAKEKNLALMTYVSPDIPQILMGDAVRLRQILLNLAGNAIKFTQYGEVVMQVVIQSENNKQAFILFEVQDTGVGISEDIEKKLFEPFIQADDSHSRKHGGTGLGLSISKRIVELMDGEIGIISEPGKGSTFWFKIPFEKINPRREEQKLKYDLSNLKIIVADDNNTSRNIFHRYFASWGIESAEVPSKDIMEHLSEDSQSVFYHIIMLDLTSFGDEIFDYAAKIQELMQDKPSCKLILITDQDTKNQWEHIEAAGFSKIIKKPIKKSHLYNCIIESIYTKIDIDEREVISHTDKEGSLALNEAGTGQSNNKKLLLAEDNIINQKLAIMQLEKMGYTVEAVNTGKKALEEAFSNDYLLILMDCQMPEMDGYEATIAIREKESSMERHIPIIAMTANAMEGDREKCLQVGMDDYISKPIKKEKLLEVIIKWT